MSEDTTQEISSESSSEVANDMPLSEGEVASQEQPQTDDVKQEIQKMIRKFKLKVDGEEIEQEIDLNDEQRIIKALQMEAVAQKRVAEARDQKKKAFDLISALEKDPKSLLKRMGDTGYSAAEELLLEKLQQEMMTPEQREMAELKAKVERYEAAQKAQQEELETQQRNAYEQKVAIDMQNQIIDALKKSEIQNPTIEDVRGVASIMKENIELGLGLDISDIAKIYLDRSEQAIQKQISLMDGQRLSKLLGKQGVKTINKFIMEEAKSKQKGFAQKQQHEMKISPNPVKKKDWMSPDEAIEFYRNKVKESQ